MAAPVVSTGNFGKATFRLTRHLSKQLLVIPASGARHAGKCYLFRCRTHISDDTRVFCCLGCERHGRGKCVTLRHLKDDDWFIVGRSDPCVGHHANCEPRPQSDVEAKDRERLTLKEAGRGLKRAREIDEETSAGTVMNKEVEKDSRPFRKIKTALHRNRLLDKKSPFCEPAQRGVTDTFSSDLSHPDCQLNPLHLYSSHDGQVHVFADEGDLKTFHEADVLAGFTCESLFTTSAACKYRMFGVVCRLPGGEVNHCALALRRTDSASFRDVWERLREASELRFGQRSSRRLVLCDDEPWAIGDLRAVFPDDHVRVSSSYFRRELWRRLTLLGLAEVYHKDVVPGVREWLRRILAMTRLPSHMVPQVWQWCLGSPPVVDNPSVACALYAFGLFVENQWVYSVSHPPGTWTHFDVDDVPELKADLKYDFCAKLKDKFGTTKYPPVAEFVTWFQQYHDANKVRPEQQEILERPRRPNVVVVKQRASRDEQKLREDMEAEKRRFVVEYERRVTSNPCDMVAYRDVVLGYLSRCADVLGFS
jgi:hypothetical protein